MSGGSYEYFYSQVQEMADQFKGQKPVLRRAFGKHLELVATALHDIEWADSSDYERGDEVAAIEAVLKDARAAELSMLVEDAKALISELEKHVSGKS